MDGHEKLEQSELLKSKGTTFFKVSVIYLLHAMLN